MKLGISEFLCQSWHHQHGSKPKKMLPLSRPILASMLLGIIRFGRVLLHNVRTRRNHLCHIHPGTLVITVVLVDEGVGVGRILL